MGHRLKSEILKVSQRWSAPRRAGPLPLEAPAHCQVYEKYRIRRSKARSCQNLLNAGFFIPFACFLGSTCTWRVLINKQTLCGRYRWRCPTGGYEKSNAGKLTFVLFCLQWAPLSNRLVPCKEPWWTMEATICLTRTYKNSNKNCKI